MRKSSRPEQALSRIPFDPREERVIDSMSRWMGLLGRFQVLAGGALVLLVIGVAIAYGATSALAPAEQAADAAPPLITLGEVTLEMLLAVGAAVTAVGALVLWGGVVLIDAAEDFEHIVHTDETHQHHLESGLRRVRRLYRIEALFTLLVLGALLAWAVPSWA